VSDAAQLEQEVEELLTIERRSPDGSVLARVALDPAFFGVTPHVPVMHQVVTAQLAARRAGTHSTKTRAEVAGGSSKPHRQKGTGRARQGSTRSPHYAGGGVAFGPKPRSYAQRTPKKMVQLALLSALSDRAMEGRVCLVGEWGFAVPKTKDAVAAVEALDLDGRILVVLEHDDVMAERSFDNIPYVDLVENNQLTAYDVLCSDWVVFTDATLPGNASVVETYDPPLAPRTAGADGSAASAAGSDETAAESAAPSTPPAPTAAAADDEDDGLTVGEADVAEVEEEETPAAAAPTTTTRAGRKKAAADEEPAETEPGTTEATSGDGPEAVSKKASGTTPEGAADYDATEAADDETEEEAE
jgi:large subunit ribosomal protein L4